VSHRKRGHGVDNWRRYLRDVRRHPLLDAREERRLILRLEAGRRAEAVLAEQDLPLRLQRLRERLVERGRAARDRLVEANLRLVIRIAVRYSQHERFQGMELLDLIQEGNIGLIMAVGNFESGYGKLSTFAAPWIRRRIYRAVADQCRILRLPTRAHAKLERLGKEERWYRAWKGRPPTSEELMTELGVDAAELARLRYAEEQDVLSLQEPVPDDETGAVYEDLVEAPESADFVQRTEDRQWLGRLLAGLPERSRRVLDGRFGHGWTLDQIGKRENLTRERVRQIERKALERLRQEDRGDAVILREHRGVARSTLEDLVGCARYEGPRRSLEEMEEAIAKGARERR
jgi:RNA polymerase primary sigma factor